jgi:hypothetical protein
MHALPDLFLDAARSGGDQLPGTLVQQQHGGGVSLEHFLHALGQSIEQRLLVEPGQRGIRADGCRLELVGPSRAVARILRLSAIDR